MRLLRSMQRGLNYAWNLASAILVKRTRQQLAGLIDLLRQSKTHLGPGDLPALMDFLELYVRENPPIAGEAYLLRLADAVAALYPMRGLRHCMRRTILRYYALHGHQQKAAFVIGVGRHPGELIGHAWIEIDGTAVGEVDDLHQKLAVIYRHP